MKEWACSDAGLDCDYVARGLTEEGLLTQVAVHAKEDHPDLVLDDEAIREVRRWIRDL